MRIVRLQQETGQKSPSPFSNNERLSLVLKDYIVGIEKWWLSKRRGNEVALNRQRN